MVVVCGGLRWFCNGDDNNGGADGDDGDHDDDGDDGDDGDDVVEVAMMPVTITLAMSMFVDAGTVRTSAALSSF